jgi:hypothetical protein
MYPFISMQSDFSTPEAALAALEDAYNRKDIEAAVAAKDFTFEAREMLTRLKNIPQPPEGDLVRQAAGALELAFRKQMEVEGFPDFTELRCKVVSKKQLSDGLVELVEECVFPDGGKSRQTMHASKNDGGWHIVVLSAAR